MGAPRGLPVGPEASGLLGNIVLLGVDEAVAGHVLGHVRYTDDSWLFLRSASDWPEVCEIYGAAASALGLEANASKVEVHSKANGEAANAMQHERIDYLVSGAAGFRTPEMAADEIRSQLDRDEPDWLLIRFHLGSIRYRRSTVGLPILDETPSILDEIPSSVGQYLTSLATDKKTRSKIDHDWLMERVTGPPHSPMSGRPTPSMPGR